MVIALFLISSCATNIKNIPDDYILSKEEGVVVLSFTSSGKCGYALFADFDGISLPYKGVIGMQSMFEARDWDRKNSTCSGSSDDFDGVLRVLSLPEGIYKIHKLSGVGRHKAVSGDNNLSVEFTVTKEAVTYLGNMHFHVQDRLFAYFLRDENERDLALFEKRYPELKGSYIIDPLQDTSLGRAD